jgi:PAS domain S-box-containing protein
VTIQTQPSTADRHQATGTPNLDRHLLTIIAGGLKRPGGSAAVSLRKRADRYRQFLDALGVAVYTTDADGRITFYNVAAAEFWGRHPKLGELWCGSLRLLFPDESPMRHDECPMAITLHEARPVRGGQAIAVRPDGSQVVFAAYPTPLFGDDGELIGAVNVLVDITDRHRAARELEASNAVKDAFLGLVSHELRTPVTTIYGNARLLQTRGADLDDAVRASMVADIATDADRLHAIIENLLHLTRLGSGAQTDIEPQVLSHVIHRSVESLQNRYPARRIDVRGRIAGVIVDADGTYLALLIENLVGNALKYSSAPDPVEIRSRVEGREVIVEVLDRGIGFDEDAADHVFETFYRSETARKAADGLGIGLALAKLIVDALGGRIWAASRDGGGAVVGFALRTSRASDQPD